MVALSISKSSPNSIVLMKMNIALNQRFSETKIWHFFGQPNMWTVHLTANNLEGFVLQWKWFLSSFLWSPLVLVIDHFSLKIPYKSVPINKSPLKYIDMKDQYILHDFWCIMQWQILHILYLHLPCKHAATSHSCESIKYCIMYIFIIYLFLNGLFLQFILLRAG